MNLALILVVLTAVSGLVVLVDRILRSRSEDAPADGSQNALVEYSRSFFPVLLFVLVIRSFIFEPFRIPSGSMMPTLLQGDFIFVKKYSYGLRLPVLETKFFETGEPERGDVVVFRLPDDPGINYIKRVVGLPGDRLRITGQQLVVNGEPVPLERDAENPVFDGMARFVETLDEREHSILVRSPGMILREEEFVVADGEYFMMGDNRDNSQDSRYIGAIPERYLVGEAVRIWMHMDGLEIPRWDRIGTKIE